MAKKVPNRTKASNAVTKKSTAKAVSKRKSTRKSGSKRAAKSKKKPSAAEATEKRKAVAKSKTAKSSAKKTLTKPAAAKRKKKTTNAHPRKRAVRKPEKRRRDHVSSRDTVDSEPDLPDYEYTDDDADSALAYLNEVNDFNDDERFDFFVMQIRLLARSCTGCVRQRGGPSEIIEAVRSTERILLGVAKALHKRPIDLALLQRQASGFGPSKATDRPEEIMRLVKRVTQQLKQGHEIEKVAKAFLFELTFYCPILCGELSRTKKYDFTYNGMEIDDEMARNVAAKFRVATHELEKTDAEGLVKCGLVTLGLPGKKTHNLFSFLNKRTKR